MSEHKHNHNALLNATLPAITADGESFTSTVITSRRPADGIVLMTKQEIEENVRRGDDGALELRDPENGEWKPQPPEVEVWELGKRLPPEKVVLDFHLATVVERRSKIIGGTGTTKTMQIIAPIASINLGAWRAGNGSAKGQG